MCVCVYAISNPVFRSITCFINASCRDCMRCIEGSSIFSSFSGEKHRFISFSEFPVPVSMLLKYKFIKHEVLSILEKAASLDFLYIRYR